MQLNAPPEEQNRETVIDLKDIPKSPVLFTRKLKGDTLYFDNPDGSKAWIKIEAIKRIDVVSIQSETEDGMRERWILRCGVKNVGNLLDEDNKPAELKLSDYGLSGKYFQGASDEFIDGLAFMVQQHCAHEIWALSLPAKEDRERVGFTKESSLNAPAVAPTATPS